MVSETIGRAPRAARRRRGVAIVLALLVTACGHPNAGPGTDIKFAHEHEPFADELFRELAAYHYRNGDIRWDPVLGWASGDSSSRYVNVVGGRRRSYEPHDPQLTVWFFGGSTMFGIGQRDDDTIPSDIARLAAAAGIRLNVVNLGVTAYVNWQETELFSQDLARGQKADLAVFYDGANEIGLASERIQNGDVDPTHMSRLLVSSYERKIWASENPPTAPSEQSDLGLREELGAVQYSDGVDLARHLATSYGVPVKFFWQPTLMTKKLGPSDAPLLRALDIATATPAQEKEVVKATIQESGVDPVDLTGALDGIHVPVYLDNSHTNEQGAESIATKIWANLRPTLEALLRAHRR